MLVRAFRHLHTQAQALWTLARRWSPVTSLVFKTVDGSASPHLPAKQLWTCISASHQNLECNWEQGVPVRVEVGPRDVAQNTCVTARRDQPGKAGKAMGVPLEPQAFVAHIHQLLKSVCPGCCLLSGLDQSPCKPLVLAFALANCPAGCVIMYAALMLEEQLHISVFTQPT